MRFCPLLSADYACGWSCQAGLSPPSPSCTRPPAPGPRRQVPLDRRLWSCKLPHPGLRNRGGTLPGAGSGADPRWGGPKVAATLEAVAISAPQARAGGAATRRSAPAAIAVGWNTAAAPPGEPPLTGAHRIEPIPCSGTRHAGAGPGGKGAAGGRHGRGAHSVRHTQAPGSGSCTCVLVWSAGWPCPAACWSAAGCSRPCVALRCLGEPTHPQPVRQPPLPLQRRPADRQGAR